jgi:hypothetical protein
MGALHFQCFTAFSLSAARGCAHDVGAQHSATRSAPLLGDFPDHGRASRYAPRRHKPEKCVMVTVAYPDARSLRHLLPERRFGAVGTVLLTRHYVFKLPRRAQSPPAVRSARASSAFDRRGRPENPRSIGGSWRGFGSCWRRFAGRIGGHRSQRGGARRVRTALTVSSSKRAALGGRPLCVTCLSLTGRDAMRPDWT